MADPCHSTSRSCVCYTGSVKGQCEVSGMELDRRGDNSLPTWASSCTVAKIDQEGLDLTKSSENLILDRRGFMTSVWEPLGFFLDTFLNSL